ncbi:MAG: PepSY domain-containing protein [Burkholderiaceae bacterium]
MNAHTLLRATVAAATVALSLQAQATGLATCDSGPREGWQPQTKLEAQLKDKGWQVRRIKEDGGCYEVYGLDEKGQRVEAYFHPVTLAPVPTKAR